MTWFLRLVGGCCLLIIVVLLARTAFFLHHAMRADGVIVVASAHPSVRFTDFAGRSTKFVQNGLVSRPIGSTVAVAYDPHNPSTTAQVVTFWTTWGIAGWLLPFGLAAAFGSQRRSRNAER